MILFSGKLIPKKRPMDLIKAFEGMRSKENAVLFFAGEGALRKEMEGYIKANDLKNIHMPGFLNQLELSKVYALADIFVFPSNDEPWGLSLNEAMCYSLPCIVSDAVSAGYDLIKEGENGFVFKAGDIEALSRKLNCLVADESLRIKMGQRSFELISTWDHEMVINGLLEAMRNSQKCC